LNVWYLLLVTLDDGCRGGQVFTAVWLSVGFSALCLKDRCI